MAKKILFFLDSFRAGGRERRAIELFQFLKKETDFDFQVVLSENIIHYKYIFDLDIPITVLRKRYIKKDPIQFYRFFKIVKEFRPDIIHCWSGMTTFYAIPSTKYYNIPLINSQIANAIPSKNRTKFDNILWKVNQHFSTIVLANSFAGLKAYKVKSKNGMVIHNGLNLHRFQNLANKELVKNKYGINTIYSIIMVASFNKFKDHNLFLKVAKKILDMRNDVTFIAVGEGATKSSIFEKSKYFERIILCDQINNVEELVNAADLGLLFSDLRTGEGLSNSIMEYMALSKPVIATDVGGNSELVANNNSGYLVDDNIEIILKHINNLLDNPEIRFQMGREGRELIDRSFTIDQMGDKFLEIYNSCF